MTRVVGRLAPSPTGALHLGNVRTFMIAWLRVRAARGKMIFRMEDLDHPKDKPGAAAQAIEDLRWLGFDWDEEFVQSERREFYREILQSLLARKLIYPCVCSRRDVELAQSAPHAGEQLFYPGTCRARFSSWQEAFAKIGRAPCWRFWVDEKNSRISFRDLFAGEYEQDVAKILGDFPLARDEDGAGYTLAAAADDLAMGVTEVVRGDDLLAATPAQMLVMRALLSDESIAKNFRTRVIPAYCHVPLVVGADGRRLAKRHGDTRISTFRESGVSPRTIIGFLASSCGWCEKGEEISLPELVSRFSLATIPPQPLSVKTLPFY